MSASARPLALYALVVGVAIAVWVVPLHLDWYSSVVITDIPLYRETAERIAGGDVPYRDFSLEYPPLAAALFWLAEPWPLTYGFAFSALMLIALCATAVAVVATARALGLDGRRQLAGGLVVAAAPVLLGNLVETRYDLAVAALIAWMVHAAVTDRMGRAWVLLGVAVLLKLSPLVLSPALLVFHLHRHGGRAALRGVAAAAGVVVIGLLPFAVAAPGGTWHLVEYHLDRPLQIESTASAYLLALHALADVDVRVENSFGSQGIAGPGTDVLAAISAAATVALVLTLLVLLARALPKARPPGDARLFVAATAATMVAAVLTSKVLSPQFMLWLLPLGLLVAGRYGWAAIGSTVAAMLLTLAYFPHQYWELVALETGPITLLVARNAMLIVLLAAAWPRAEIGQPPEVIDLPPDASSSRGARAQPARLLAD